MNEGSNWREEEVHAMDREFDDQQKGAQYSDDQIVVVQTEY